MLGIGALGGMSEGKLERCVVGDDGGMWVGIMLCWLGELVYGLCRRYFRHVTKIAPVPMYPHLRVNSGVG